MAMNAGTCAVSENGTVSGSGLSREILNAFAAEFTERGSDVLWAQSMARFAKVIASAIVLHITTNAEVQGSAHVTNQSLGRIPATPVEGTPISSPASAVDIPLASTSVR
jgi:hypothetical protein